MMLLRLDFNTGGKIVGSHASNFGVELQLGWLLGGMECSAPEQLALCSSSCITPRVCLQQQDCAHILCELLDCKLRFCGYIDL